jgi:cell division protease FtsH
MPNFARNIFAWLMIALLLAGMYQYFNPQAGGADSQSLPYSELLAQADKGLVAEATLRGDGISGKLTSGATTKC